MKKIICFVLIALVCIGTIRTAFSLSEFGTDREVSLISVLETLADSELLDMNNFTEQVRKCRDTFSEARDFFEDPPESDINTDNAEVLIYTFPDCHPNTSAALLDTDPFFKQWIGEPFLIGSQYEYWNPTTVELTPTGFWAGFVYVLQCIYSVLATIFFLLVDSVEFAVGLLELMFKLVIE